MTFTDAWGEYALNNIQERLDPNPNNIDDFMNITRLVREATGKNGAFSAYRAEYEAIRAGAGVAKTRDFKHDARMKMYNLYNKLFGSDQAQNDLGFVYTEGKPESLRALDFSQGILNGLVQGLTPDKEGLKNLNAFAKDLQELKPWDNIGERVKVGLTASGVAAITLLVPEAIVEVGAPAMLPATIGGIKAGVDQVKKAYKEGWSQYSSNIESGLEKPWLEGNDSGAAAQFGAVSAGIYMTVRPPTGELFKIRDSQTRHIELNITQDDVAGLDKFGPKPPATGQKVFRVWGQDPSRPDLVPDQSGPWGRSWTRVDPRTVPNFRNAAGLPDNANMGRFVSEGRLIDSSGVTARRALQIGKNVGGLDELEVPDAVKKVILDNVSGMNPPF